MFNLRKILTNAVFLVFWYFVHLLLFFNLYIKNCNNINIPTRSKEENIMYFKFIFVSTFIVTEMQNRDVSQA